MTGTRRFAWISLAVAAAGVVALTLAACTGGGAKTLKVAASGSPARSSGPVPAQSSGPVPAQSSSPVTGAPETPPAQICGNGSDLNGPATMPAGAIRVPAGSDANFNFSRPNTTYWFAPGLHTLGTEQYENIVPANGDTYVGAPGAVLDGQHSNNSAFDGGAQHVVIEYLTIRNFGTWGGGQQEGAVNHDSGTYWTIIHSTISGNAGAGVMLGSHDILSWNCIQNNQQYGFNAYSNSGEIVDLWLDHNEIINNDTYNYEARLNGCGCSGGGKFWNVINARVTNNWVVDNKSVGLWADTNNAGFEFVGNYIQNNEDVGLQYEISYNALIEFNTFDHNGVEAGPANTGFPTSAVYISESGSDSRVNTNYKNQFLIAHNNFVDNWGGVILWENSNRFCGSPDNTSTGYCTMVDPKATLKTCSTPALVKTQPYLADCRWETKNVLVEDNTFTFTPSALGKACTPANNCGYNGVFSEYGSDPSWSPYHGDLVPTNITFHQNNVFSANTYSGPWCFMGWQLGTSMSFSRWQGAANVANAQLGQDAGSTHTGASRACS